MTIDQKAFSGLQARAALARIELLRTDPADGPVRLLMRCDGGSLRELNTIEEVEAVVVASRAEGSAK
jgi:hypothetical protein